MTRRQPGRARREARGFERAARARSVAMKIVGLDAIPVSVPYRLRETSAVIDRGGVSDVIVKLVRGSPSGSRRQQSVRRDQRAPGRRHERGEPFEQFQQLQHGPNRSAQTRSRPRGRRRGPEGP
jgi:hypothetical protein